MQRLMSLFALATWLVFVFPSTSWSGTQMQHIVSNAGDLANAIRTASAGDEVLLENNGSSYSIQMRDKSFDGRGGRPDGIVFRSADPDNPAVIDTLKLGGVSHVAIENVVFDSSAVRADRPDWMDDVIVFGGADIAIRDSRLIGTATERLTPENVGEERAENMSLIRHVDGFVFENNVVSNYNHALQVREARNIEISGNEITALQGDGMRLAGLINTVIEGNYIHDFIGSDHNVNHMDMIQLWSTNTTARTENLKVIGNALDSGSGQISQAIFMRNEQVDLSNGARTDRVYKDIEISNNVIYNGHLHGIAVGETNGLEISNNTIVANRSTEGQPGFERDSFYNPVIKVSDGSTGVSISNNITADVRVPAGSDVTGNVIVDYSDRRAQNYVDNLFVNKGAGLEGLVARPGGPLDGSPAGAADTQFDATPEDLTATFTSEQLIGEINAFRFDASLSANDGGRLDDGGVYSWLFEDGTTMVGRVVTRSFDSVGQEKVVLTVATPDGRQATSEAEVNLANPVLLDIDLEGGKPFDNSSYDSQITLLGDVEADGSFKVWGDRSLKVDRGSSQLFNLEQFSLTFDFKRSDADSGAGKLASVFKSFELRLLDNGELSFWIDPFEGGARSFNTRGAKLQDEEWHRIALVFDGLTDETAKIYLDGQLLGGIVVSGGTKPAKWWHLEFGSAVDRGVSGAFDNIKVEQQPLSDAEIEADFQAFAQDRADLPADADDVDHADAGDGRDEQADAGGANDENPEGTPPSRETGEDDRADFADLDFLGGDEVHLEGYPARFFNGLSDDPSGRSYVVDSVESLVRLISHEDINFASTRSGGVEIRIDAGEQSDPTLRIDRIEGRSSADILRKAESGQLHIGGAADERFMTGEAADVIAAGAGDDTLDGRGGGDWLLGGEGDDTLTGGSGSNTYEGGAGADVFTIQGWNIQAGQVDHLVDLNFEQGDQLTLSRFGAGTFRSDVVQIESYDRAWSSGFIRDEEGLANLAALERFSIDHEGETMRISIDTPSGDGVYTLLI